MQSLKNRLFGYACLLLAFPICLQAQKKPATPSPTEKWKAELVKAIDQKSKMAQEMVDMVFSFAELGFQETESSKYLTNILEKNGFKVEYGIAGIPTAWMATWEIGRAHV